MDRDILSPEAILEELSDKAAAQIGRRAPVAFAGALTEMVRYHSFLLALNSEIELDNAPVNLAENDGTFFIPPHRIWIRQYIGLFERAATIIADDETYLEQLSRVHYMIISQTKGIFLSNAIVEAILDLGPLLMHKLENWVTKQRQRGAGNIADKEYERNLAGSDASAYASFLERMVENWEHLLSTVPANYKWTSNRASSDYNIWNAYQNSWPFIKQHLINTAHCLTLAVWNADDIGAQSFTECLLSWRIPPTDRLIFKIGMQYTELLTPELLYKDWQESLEFGESIREFSTSKLHPDELFTAITKVAHGDIVFIIAELAIYWNIKFGKSPNLTRNIVRNILTSKTIAASNYYYQRIPDKINLDVIFFNLIRQEVAGEIYKSDTYGDELDRFIGRVDFISERRVPGGRIYAPSTISSREELTFSLIIFLCVAANESEYNNIASNIIQLCELKNDVKNFDSSMRRIVFKLDDILDRIKRDKIGIIEYAKIISSDYDHEISSEALVSIIIEVKTIIEKNLNDISD